MLREKYNAVKSLRRATFTIVGLNNSSLEVIFFIGVATWAEEFSIASDAWIWCEKIWSEEARIADGKRWQRDRAAGPVKEVRVATNVDRSGGKHAAAQREL